MPKYGGKKSKGSNYGKRCQSKAHTRPSGSSISKPKSKSKT